MKKLFIVIFFWRENTNQGIITLYRIGIVSEKKVVKKKIQRENQLRRIVLYRRNPHQKRKLLILICLPPFDSSNREKKGSVVQFEKNEDIRMRQ